MSGGAHDQQVLFEARRKLSALRIESQFTARGDALKGALLLTGAQIVPNPFGGPSIEHITFTVQGNGSLSVDQPEPLRGLALGDARSIASRDALAEGLRRALDGRAARLRGQALRLSQLGLPYEIDAERVGLTARLELGHLGTAELESDGERLIARDLVGPKGDRKSFGELPIALDDFMDAMDLELFVSSHAERLVPEQVAPSIVSGHMAADDHLLPTIELDEEVTAMVEGMQPPATGEVWVMEVRVESGDREEVRYQAVNVAGQIYGAPRVLPRIAFLSLYLADDTGYRMHVQVADVDEQYVSYVRLDASRRPASPQRSVPLVVFLASFRPERAAW